MICCSPIHPTLDPVQLVGSSTDPDSLKARVVSAQFAQLVSDFHHSSFDDLFPHVGHPAVEEIDEPDTMPYAPRALATPAAKRLRQTWAKKAASDNHELGVKLGLKKREFEAYLVQKANEAIGRMSPRRAPKEAQAQPQPLVLERDMESDSDSYSEGGRDRDSVQW